MSGLLNPEHRQNLKDFEVLKIKGFHKLSLLRLQEL